MRTALALGLLWLSAAAVAQPVITSVTPSSGPLSGGTEITITGSGFRSDCGTTQPCTRPQPVVYFGTVTAASTRLVDAQTIVVTTPQHLPGVVDIFLSQFNGSSMLPKAFTFTGEATTAFDRLLLPIFVAPVHGAFGSLFVTHAEMWNKDDVADIPLYGGIPTPCPILCPPVAPESPFMLQHAYGTRYIDVYGGNPGRILFVPKDSAGSVALNLRVYDTSRIAATAGTEIPVARERDFRSDSVALLGVPWHPNFRNMLRIYSASPDGMNVRVRFAGTPDVVRVVALRPGVSLFDPAYAEVSDFPAAPLVPLPTGSYLTMTITIEVEVPPVVPPGPTETPKIWAFITSTNNTTQEITVVSPQ